MKRLLIYPDMKPIIKWIGGKTQIINEIINKFPSEMNNYHEIFLGGGSALLGLLEAIKKENIICSGKIYAYDSNIQLINMFKDIQNNHEELYTKLLELIQAFNQSESKESYYYECRNIYNHLCEKRDQQLSTNISASFIFLNKTCFRGLYRVGPRGFNVPYGNYKSPEIINKGHLDAIHMLVQNVVFNVSDFSESMKNIEEGDFVYMDPPYFPENTSSFVKYTKNGFNANQHIKLFKTIHGLTGKKIKILLSNSDTTFIRDSFIGYKIQQIICKRRINSKNPQATTTELLITN